MLKKIGPAVDEISLLDSTHETQEAAESAASKPAMEAPTIRS